MRLALYIIAGWLSLGGSALFAMAARGADRFTRVTCTAAFLILIAIVAVLIRAAGELP